MLLIKNFLGLFTLGQVHTSNNLPEWQAVKPTFFAPWIHTRKMIDICLSCSNYQTRVVVDNNNNNNNKYGDFLELLRLCHVKNVSWGQRSEFDAKQVWKVLLNGPTIQEKMTGKV